MDVRYSFLDINYIVLNIHNYLWISKKWNNGHTKNQIKDIHKSNYGYPKIFFVLDIHKLIYRYIVYLFGIWISLNQIIASQPFVGPFIYLPTTQFLHSYLLKY